MAFRDRVLSVTPLPIGYYEFNLSDGRQTIPGGLPDATFTGSNVTFPTDGIDGTIASGSYLGTNNEITLNAAELNTIDWDEFTIAFWVRRPSYADNGHVFSFLNGLGNEISARFEPDGNDRCRFTLGRQSPLLSTHITTPSFTGRENDWIFMALTQGSEGSDVYIDGIHHEGSDQITSIGSFSITRILADGINDELDGDLDEFLIYDRRLTAAEISYLFSGWSGATSERPFTSGYEFHLEVRDRHGAIKRSYVQPTFIRFTDHLNEGWPIVFTLHEDHELIKDKAITQTAVGDLAEGDIITVYMRNRSLGIMGPSGEHVRAVVGILRDWEQFTDEEGLTFFTFVAYDAKKILAWRSVLWPAGTDNRSSWSNKTAERILKDLVAYNFTYLATSGNGRQRNGQLDNSMGYVITVPVNLDRGRANLYRSYQGDVVLDALNDLAKIGNGDWYLDFDGTNGWIFDFFPGQLGEDKTSGQDRVVFSLATQTLKEPLKERMGAVATVAVVAGQGKGTIRKTAVVTSPNYSPLNDIELFVDARDEENEANLPDRGLSELDGKGTAVSHSFQVFQTADIFYSPRGTDVAGRKVYRPGDLVLVDYGGQVTQKVLAITVNWQESRSESRARFDLQVVDP